MTKGTDTVDSLSFAVPTEKDMETFHALSPEQRRALVEHELRKGAESGVSSLTMDEIWSEAERRVPGKAEATMCTQAFAASRMAAT